MLTVFSTPKPFVGHVGVIQRNAISSWMRLHPDVEVILVGDDAGTAEVCAEFGIGILLRESATGTGLNIWRIFTIGRRRRLDMRLFVM